MIRIRREFDLHGDSDQQLELRLTELRKALALREGKLIRVKLIQQAGRYAAQGVYEMPLSSGFPRGVVDGGRL